MTEPDGDLETLLAGLRTEFLSTARCRVEIIRQEASDLAIAADPAGALARLIREAHTLKGGGAIFGCASLGDAGGEIERIGKSLVAAGAPLPPLGPLHAAVAELERLWKAEQQ